MKLVELDLAQIRLVTNDIYIKKSGRYLSRVGRSLNFRCVNEFTQLKIIAGLDTSKMSLLLCD